MSETTSEQNYFFKYIFFLHYIIIYQNKKLSALKLHDLKFV